MAPSTPPLPEHYEKVKAFFEGAAQRYSQHPRDFRTYYFAQRLAIAMALLPEMPGRLLDVGCGDGVVYDYLVGRQPTRDYLGIDISPAMLALSRIPPTQQQTTTLEAFAQRTPPASVDTLIALGLTTYYPAADLPAFYQAIDQLLVPGGRVIISYTHAQSWDYRLRQGLHRWLGALLPKKRSLGRSFPIYATTAQALASSLPPHWQLQNVVYLPAAIPLLTHLTPQGSVRLAKGWLNKAGKNWRADFVVAIEKGIK